MTDLPITDLSITDLPMTDLPRTDFTMHDSIPPPASLSHLESPPVAIPLEAIQQVRLDYDRDVTLLLKTNSGQVLLGFIQRELQNFHLQGLYSPAYVFNEAFIRGTVKISRGELIQYPAAWLKRTAFNIIRELSRDRGKTTSFDELQEHGKGAIALYSSETDATIETAIAEKFQAVAIAYHRLAPRDQRILQLKVIDNLSWQAIAQQLAAEGFGTHTVVALRKQKERILERLRQGI